MNWEQEAVELFHEATNQTVGLSPELRDRDLRAKLIMEEAVETVAAMGFDVTADIKGLAYFTKRYPAPHFEDAIDGLADLQYVVLGSAVAWGIDLGPFFEEVHRANMDKLRGPKRADGKQLKPDDWRPPDIAGTLEKERQLSALWLDITDGSNVLEPDV